MQGFLLVNKPKGITSFAAVAIVKRLCNEKRVGHTGTLDPMATGVLPIFLGKATTLSRFVLNEDKRYKAKIKLGVTTDTDDITGEVLTENKVDITESQLNEALARFEGRQEQLPPMYSAIKKDGVRLYKLAREGKTAEIEKRSIEVFFIHKLSDLDKDNCFEVDVYVSKGTYIRSLARDIGEFLGCGATLAELERTACGDFCIDNCIDLELLKSDNVFEYIQSEEAAIKQYKTCMVSPKQAVRFCNGGQLDLKRLKIENATNGEFYRVKCEDVFLGMGSIDCENNRLNIECIVNKFEL